jgi:hypothetical protein
MPSIARSPCSGRATTPTGSSRGVLRAEIARLQAEAARLADVIATGGMDSAALVAALQERGRRLSVLRVELHSLGSATRAAHTGAGALRARLEERLTEWRGVLRRQVGETSQILRHLLVGDLPSLRGRKAAGGSTLSRVRVQYQPYCQDRTCRRTGDPGGIRTRDLDLERVASLARLDDGVPGPTAVA